MKIKTSQYGGYLIFTVLVSNWLESKAGDLLSSMDKRRKKRPEKKINYVISNISDINPYLPRFIPDSIYITNSVIYIYGNINFDYEKVIKKYRRYTNKIETIVANDMFFIKVDVGNARNSFFKDKIYFIIDNLEVFADKIGDILVG